MGVMNNPFHWMADADIGLMKSVMRCFAESSSHQVAVRPFKKLLQTMEQAMQSMRSRRSEDQPNISQFDDIDARALLDQHPPMVSATGQAQAGTANNLNFSTDFHFQDFFDFGGAGEAANMLQLWPLDFELGPDEFENDTVGGVASASI
jgi:hypothetical protein